MGVTEYHERRRMAVAKELARLAFVVSDLVMFIWNESFANASYMQRVRRLAYESTEGVDSASSPALILIYNKCSLDEQFDVEKCTSDFFSNAENAEILKLYSEVKVRRSRAFDRSIESEGITVRFLTVVCGALRCVALRI